MKILYCNFEPYLLLLPSVIDYYTTLTVLLIFRKISAIEKRTKLANLCIDNHVDVFLTETWLDDSIHDSTFSLFNRFNVSSRNDRSCSYASQSVCYLLNSQIANASICFFSSNLNEKHFDFFCFDWAFSIPGRFSCICYFNEITRPHVVPKQRGISRVTVYWTTA